MSTTVLAVIAVIAGSISTLCWLFVNVPLGAVSEDGSRGAARMKARNSWLFRLVEPLIRLIASHIAKRRLPGKREKIDDALITAGEFSGFSPDEFLAANALTSLVGLATAIYVFTSHESGLLALFCLAVGVFLPWIRLKSQRDLRTKEVDRGLPNAIDLASLCMGAGLDFPGAIKQVVSNMSNTESPVRQELERILQEIALGHTRRQALEGLGRRVKTTSVQEFVAAIVQGEERGTPISEVLAIQATVLRGRRSVLAEEAAARAGVMLMLPMLMTVASTLLLLFGPLLIDLVKGDML